MNPPDRFDQHESQPDRDMREPQQGQQSARVAEPGDGPELPGGRRLRAQARRRRRQKRALAGVVLVLVVAAIVVLGVRRWYTTQLGAWGEEHPVVEVMIPEGSTTQQIGDLLTESDVVRNARAFSWRVRFSNSGPFEAGRYEFPSRGSVDDAISTLERGPLGPKIVRVSIPEGFRVGQIIDRVSEEVPRMSATDLEETLASGSVDAPFRPVDQDNFEGLLFPATYDVTEDMTPAELLQAMADAMSARARNLDLQSGADALGLSPYQVLIVASLVQSEAGNPDEAPKIARVIYNRLDIGMPLGIDATSRYLSIITGDDVDFESSSPYNTRRQQGLPPTPISAPGDFAIEAALHPSEGPWTWYVRDVNDDAQGRPQHFFTDSQEEFNRAKQLCYEDDLGCGQP